MCVATHTTCTSTHDVCTHIFAYRFLNGMLEAHAESTVLKTHGHGIRLGTLKG